MEERATILDRLFDSGPPLLLPIVVFVIWLVLVVIFTCSKNKANLNVLMPIMMIPPCLAAGSAFYGYFCDMLMMDTIGMSGGMDPGRFFSNVHLVAFGGQVIAVMGILSTIGSWVLFFSSFRKIASTLTNS